MNISTQQIHDKSFVYFLIALLLSFQIISHNNQLYQVNAKVTYTQQYSKENENHEHSSDFDTIRDSSIPSSPEPYIMHYKKHAGSIMTKSVVLPHMSTATIGAEDEPTIRRIVAYDIDMQPIHHYDSSFPLYGNAMECMLMMLENDEDYEEEEENHEDDDEQNKSLNEGIGVTETPPTVTGNNNLNNVDKSSSYNEITAVKATMDDAERHVDAEDDKSSDDNEDYVVDESSTIILKDATKTFKNTNYMGDHKGRFEMSVKVDTPKQHQNLENSISNPSLTLSVSLTIPINTILVDKSNQVDKDYYISSLSGTNNNEVNEDIHEYDISSQNDSNDHVIDHESVKEESSVLDQSNATSTVTTMEDKLDDYSYDSNLDENMEAMSDQTIHESEIVETSEFAKKKGSLLEEAKLEMDDENDAISEDIKENDDESIDQIIDETKEAEESNDIDIDNDDNDHGDDGDEIKLKNLTHQDVADMVLPVHHDNERDNVILEDEEANNTIVEEKIVVEEPINASLYQSNAEDETIAKEHEMTHEVKDASLQSGGYEEKEEIMESEPSSTSDIEVEEVIEEHMDEVLNIDETTVENIIKEEEVPEIPSIVDHDEKEALLEPELSSDVVAELETVANGQGFDDNIEETTIESETDEDRENYQGEIEKFLSSEEVNADKEEKDEETFDSPDPVDVHIHTNEEDINDLVDTHDVLKLFEPEPTQNIEGGIDEDTNTEDDTKLDQFADENLDLNLEDEQFASSTIDDVVLESSTNNDAVLDSEFGIIDFDTEVTQNEAIETDETISNSENVDDSTYINAAEVFDEEEYEIMNVVLEQEEYEDSTYVLEEDDSDSGYTESDQVIDDNVEESFGGDELADGEESEESSFQSVSSDPDKSSVNQKFVTGLDDLHKFFEDVDPPDELDPGAIGKSLEEILKSQGIQIIKTNLNKSIQSIRKTANQCKDKLKNIKSGINIRLPPAVTERFSSTLLIVQGFIESNEETIDNIKDFLNDVKVSVFQLKDDSSELISNLVENTRQVLQKIGIIENDDFESLYEYDEDESMYFDNVSEYDEDSLEEMRKTILESYEKNE